VRPGLVHAAIFLGMILLFLGTVLATVDQDVTLLFFNFQFLRGDFYLIYKLVLDIAALLVAAGLTFAAYRRFVQKPPRLNGKWRDIFAWDDAYGILFLALIVVLGPGVSPSKPGPLAPAAFRALVGPRIVRLPVHHHAALLKDVARGDYLPQHLLPRPASRWRYSSHRKH
jgi:hypothetical protein